MQEQSFKKELTPVNSILQDFLLKEESKQQSFKADIKKLIKAMPSSLDKPFMSVSEASWFLNISNSTIYKLNFRKEIPYYKTGKKVFYSKEDLISYVTKNRVMSRDEVESEVAGRMKKFQSKF